MKCILICKPFTWYANYLLRHCHIAVYKWEVELGDQHLLKMFSTLSISPTKIPPLRNMKGLVPCAVCQMPSTGRHYGVYTCGGCRNFFRRSQILHKTYNCGHAKGEYFQKCKMCRYNACIDVGMRMDASKVGRPTDQEKVAVSEYIGKLNSDNGSCDNEFPPTDPTVAMDPEMKEFVDKLTFLTTKFHCVMPKGNLSTNSVQSSLCQSVQKLENDVAEVSNFVRSMPGMSASVSVADRVVMFTKAIFPILTLRSISSNANSLPSMLGLSEQSAMLLLQYFNQENIAYLLEMFSNLKYKFNQLNFNLEDISLAYGLLCFNGQNLFNSYLESRMAVESLVQMYSDLSMTIWSPNRHQQMTNFLMELDQITRPMLFIVQEMLCFQGENKHESSLLQELVKRNDWMIPPKQ